MLAAIAWLSLGVAVLCAIVIALDELRHGQHMWIMNVVWPVTALYLGPFALWGYFRYGRTGRHFKSTDPPQVPGWFQVAEATSHCGAGCVVGDIAAEYLVMSAGLTLFGLSLWASYLVDFGAAWLLGIIFQYFTIKPMRNLSASQALMAAIKADTLSILAFQIGMYAWMALVFFVFFPGPHLRPDEPVYWLMMQIAMVFGFLTAYPMNRWLLRIGIKESMG